MAPYKYSSFLFLSALAISTAGRGRRENLQRSRICWTTTENRDVRRVRTSWTASRRRTDRETRTRHSLPANIVASLFTTTTLCRKKTSTPMACCNFDTYEPILIITSFHWRCKSIATSLSVCLSVRLHISKTTCPNFTKFSVQVTCDRGSVLFWR